MRSAADVELRDGDDLVVRGWREGDAEAVGFTPRDPEIGRYFGRPFVDSPPFDPATDWFAIVEHGVPVGRLWFRPASDPREVGYFLRPDAWGRGLASRSLRLVVDWHGPPLVLYTHPENVASQRVALKAGFRPDGDDPRYARFDDGTTAALRFAYPSAR